MNRTIQIELSCTAAMIAGICLLGMVAVCILVTIWKRKRRNKKISERSHKMKGYLTSISGYAELMENGLITDMEEVKRVSQNIHKNSDDLLDTLNEAVYELRKKR